MADFTILLPYLYAADPTKGRPVYNGSIYIGEPDKDPELFPIQAFTLNEDGSQTALLQPIKTGAGGVPMYNGSAVIIQTSQNYSMRIRDVNGAQVYYVGNAANAGGAGGGSGDGDFIPLAGTNPGEPVTGSVETFSPGGGEWTWGNIGQVGFEGFYVFQLNPTAGYNIGFLNNSFATTYNDKGEWRVQTVYDQDVNPNALATVQYVLDQTGGAGAAFIPLAGTIPTEEVTGIITFKNATLNEEWGLGIAEGVTDAFTIAPTSNTGGDSSLFLTTGDGDTNVNNFHFQADGYLDLPDIDYSLGTDFVAVNKKYVDDVAGGGTPNLYVPLAGTDPLFPVTGVIKFENAALGKKYQIGIINSPGIAQDMYIGAFDDNANPSSIFIGTGGTLSSFDNNGDLTTARVYANQGLEGDGSASWIKQGLAVGDSSAIDAYLMQVHGDVGITGQTNTQGIVCTGIIDTGGASFAGAVTIANGAAEYDLDVDGQLRVSGSSLMSNIVAQGVQGTFLSQTGAQITNPGSMVRYDTLQNWEPDNVMLLTTAQTASGRKTFSDGVSSGATIVTPGINVSGSPLVGIVQPLLGGAGTRFVKVDNNGGFFASASAAVADIDGLETRLQSLENQLVAVLALVGGAP